MRLISSLLSILFLVASFYESRPGFNASSTWEVMEQRRRLSVSFSIGSSRSIKETRHETNQCPSQQAPHMQETFLCTRTEAIKSTNPVAHPVPNPCRNAKHGCLERRSEEIPVGKRRKSCCNTSQVERQEVAVWSTASVVEGGQRGYGCSVHQRG